MADLLADVIAALHIAYFVFIVGGTIAIVIPARPWWVRRWTFRVTHLLAVYVVLAENVLHLPCPLNVAQWSLRTAQGGSQERTDGVSGLLDWLLFHAISGQVLNLLYVGLGVLLPVLLVVVPPRRRARMSHSQAV